MPVADGAKLAPGSGRMQFRYTGIYLSAPERVRYSYRLEGLDGEWISSVARRVTNYNSLPHGRYRFTVRASVPNGPSSESSFAFELLPHFYETAWFRYFCAALIGCGHLGPVQLAAASNSPAIFAGAGRARAAGAGNSRYAGAGLRGDFVATGCRGAHPQRPRGPGAQAFGAGAQNGAA